LQTAVLQKIHQHSELVSGAVTGKTNKPVEPHNSELKNIKSELDRNTYFLKGLYESLVCGDISDDEYRELKKSYETRIASLKEQEKCLRDETYKRSLHETERAKVTENVSVLNTIADLSAEIIDTLIEKVFVYDDNRVEIQFKFTEETEGAAL
jgi:hypothetical protein